MLRFSLCIPVSAGDAAAVKSNEVKTLLATGWITFFYSKQFSFY